MTPPLRGCENEKCGKDISHRRTNARFCDRTCSAAHYHATHRASPEGKAREAARNKARYANEAERRREYARGYYDQNQEYYVEHSRQWRRNNSHRRRDQRDRRAALMADNPGFVPFGSVEWEALKRRHAYRCAYCGERPAVLEMDHVIPLTRGGRHAIANILPSCPSCNRSKSSSLLIEWRIRRERG